jgi:hypothetical protein
MGHGACRNSKGLGAMINMGKSALRQHAFPLTAPG